MWMCFYVCGCAHTSMQMTGLHTYDMSTPLRECAHMCEWGRANVQHDKSIHRGLYVCVWRELRLIFSCLVLLLQSIRRYRDNTENWSSGQIKSCSTHRCAVKAPGAPGTEQGPASQTGWVIAHPRDRDQHKLHINLKKCVGRWGGCKKTKKKKTSYQHNELCFDSLLAYFARGGCHKQMYKSDSHHYY